MKREGFISLCCFTGRLATMILHRITPFYLMMRDFAISFHYRLVMAHADRQTRISILIRYQPMLLYFAFLIATSEGALCHMVLYAIH